MSDVSQPTWHRSRKRYESYARDGHLGFETPIHQRLRYEALLQHVDPTGMRMLDYGCGHGALFEELVLRGRCPATYHGVDLVDECLAEARRRSTSLLGIDSTRGLTRYGAHLDGPYDLVCALAVLSVDEGPHTLKLWKDTIERLWACTERTLVFDLLREEPGFDHVGHRRVSIRQIAKIASDLSRNHLIDATYADHFALVVVHRSQTKSRQFWELRESTC